MFWDRFDFLCRQNKMSPNGVVEIVGLSTGICTKWKNGATPKAEILLKIAEYFDCSVDYLLGNTENPKSHKERSTNMVTGNYNAIDNSRVTINSEGNLELSVDESEIIRIFRQLDAKQRHRMMSFAFDLEKQAIKPED